MSGSVGAVGSRMEPASGVRPQPSDEQWALIVDLFPSPPPSPKGGRPRFGARVLGRHSLGAGHRRSLEGPAAFVPVVRHLLETLR